MSTENQNPPTTNMVFHLPAEQFVTRVIETELSVGFASELPPGLRAYVDEKKRLMVHFLAADITVEIDHPLVRSYLIVTLAKGKSRAPTKDELEVYYHRLRISALGNIELAPNTPEWWDARLWANPLAMAVVTHMEQWWYGEGEQGKHGLGRIYTLTNWREKLVKTATDNHLDPSKWREKNWFRVDLEEQAELLRHFNIRIGAGRSAAIRQVTIEFIDASKIPEWDGHVVKR